MDTHRHCNEIGVGSAASSDGSVLLAYNNEFTGNNRLSVIPVASVPLAQAVQPKPGAVLPSQALNLAKTFACQRICVDLEVPEASSEGGLNSAGVATNFGVYNYVPGNIVDSDKWKKNGISFELWDIILQRSSNVEDALAILAGMLNSIGASYDVAGSFMIADPHDIWVVEIITGSNWAAARIPRNAYLAQANMLRIGVINFNDPANFRTSPGLQNLAIKLGLYHSGPFDFAGIFNSTNLMQPWARNRIWDMIRIMSPSLGFDIEAPAAPVFTVPDAPISMNTLRRVQKDHYENTAYDLSQNYTLGSPHLMVGEQPLCKKIDTYNLIFKLKAGCSYLLIAPTCACLSVPTPFFADSLDNPMAWRGDLISSQHLAVEPYFLNRIFNQWLSLTCFRYLTYGYGQFVSRLYRSFLIFLQHCCKYVIDLSISKAFAR